MLGIVETWEEEEEAIKKKFEGYSCKVIGAIKENKKGRAKGGIVIVAKNKWSDKEIEWKIGNISEVIGARVVKKEEKILIIVVYMNEEKERNRKEIEKWIEEDLESRVITLRKINYWYNFWCQ